MDPSQAIGTTPSRANNVDPTGSDSGTETVPSGHTGASGTTGTTQAQRIPPIETSNQDRSPSIDQTSIPERVGARVWNRSGDRQSTDDPTRSQFRTISPTPLAQTRGELAKIRRMVSNLIDEIRSQKIANQTITNRLEQAEKELADHPANSGDPKHSIWTLHGENSQRPPKLKLQWIRRNRYGAPIPTNYSNPIP
ncbi:hypothetical protein F2Q70_00013483 [Brassica cretica]|uniref:Uncharacterized protein n=1 Tax=Brassica cretica TaxID=69181 RepID=A0A8S9LW63_BRACR|nr:hypothetical protein F2Q70_00013483 [Brassica cretica]